MNLDVIVPVLNPIAREFYIAKGVIGLTSTLLLIVHMTQTWGQVAKIGQRLRYYTLLLFAFLITTASVEQVGDHSDVNLRNVAFFFASIVLAIAAVVSIVQDTRQPPRGPFSH